MNLVKWWEERCERYPENVALIQEDEVITYAELGELIRGFAGYLQGQGIRKGDAVVLMLPNCLEFVVAYFAIISCGGVAVKVSTVSVARELRHILDDSAAVLIVARPDQEKKYAEISDTLPRCRGFIAVNGVKSIPQQQQGFSQPEIGGEDTAVMIYTAGLSGKSLGAQLTHRNLLSQTPLLGECFGATASERGLAVIPFFHAFGIVANLLTVLHVGGSVVIMEHFTMGGIFAAIARERVSYIAAVPRLFLGMLFQEGMEDFDISSLKFGITGGCAAPRELFPAFEQRFGARLWEGYGLTETSPVAIVSRSDRAHKPGSIGTTLAYVEAKIVDDVGNELPVGQVGELLLRGANVMKGYHGAPEATAQVLSPHGWLRTGDLLRRDEDGYFYFAGLKKRMIITSGFNVYPREVEEVLLSCPEVAAASVYGKSDPMRGEIVCARVTPKDGCTVDERELLRFLRRQLSPYKVPREMEIEAT